MKYDEIKKFANETYLKIQRIGFWVLILILLGASIGAFGARKYFQSTIDDSIKMGRFIHNGIVYDVSKGSDVN